MDSLHRLSASIDAQLPTLVLFVIVRWLADAACGPLRRALVRAFARRVPRTLRAARVALVCTRSVCTVSLIVYFGIDALPSEFCGVQQRARPLGIAAATALVLLVLSSRVMVCLSCIVTLMCCRDRTTAADAAAVTTFVLWAQPEGGDLLVLGIVPVVAAHATKCKSPSSAALAVLCFFHIIRLGAVRAAKWLYRRAVRRRYVTRFDSEKRS